jgi:hypothetical protein
MEVEPSQLMECADQALDISKQVTMIVREAWENRGQYSLSMRTEPKNEIENIASA